MVSVCNWVAEPSYWIEDQSSAGASNRNWFRLMKEKRIYGQDIGKSQGSVE